MTWKLDPLTKKRIKRFRSIRRGYYSFLVLALLFVLTMVAEIFINNRALVVSFEGQLYFPTYGAVIPGTTFGLDYEYETDYRALAEKFAEDKTGWILMPFVPYSPNEIPPTGDSYPPTPPDFSAKHYFGTDTIGRDVLARLVYGFRVAMLFSLALLVCSYIIGILLGCTMGYFGGWFDLLVQRLIEIWANIPILYVIIIIASIVEPTFAILILIKIALGWTGMTWYMRTETYREKAREYVLAARSMGASVPRILIQHIVPNSIAVIVTLAPFSIQAGMVSLVSLDYLGFGLPARIPSWGELLYQGQEHLEASWIVTSVTACMIIILTMVTFIGEAVREAFDPKKHTTYEG